MIYLYPANKMENLLALLDKIQQLSPLPVFSPDVIIVQNPGMQHWLNLSLAKQRGISMNTRYALPSQFLWKLIRTVADDESIPEQVLFSREVLTWKIHALLASNEVVNSPEFAMATAYWQAEDIEQKIDLSADSNNTKNDGGALKRYQLACQIADLFEQYIIFRPEWINDWEQGVFDNISVPQNSQEEGPTENDLLVQAKWQGILWHMLTKEQAYNPMQFIQNAINNLPSKVDELPKRISFFGINAMAPLWLEFINALSEHTQVHFFHLNPCYAYWGDVLTEKKAIKSIEHWVDGVTTPEALEDNSNDEVTHLVGNPLLANLGQQGREFMALLHSYSTINIEAFEAITNEVINNEFTEADTKDKSDAASNTLSLLNHIQHDVLSLHDARAKPTVKHDASITVTSCHSALREVQGFHDWLLAQFNQDPSLTPKDVLVMCPQIEEYAPYVNAVFTHGWQDIDDKVPPLPCSIADRVSKDAEPMVAAFIQLLTLPDSRFQVSSLMSYLRLPAMQNKFGFTLAEIDKISVWLEHACIHWGLDGQHKTQVLNAVDGKQNPEYKSAYESENEPASEPVSENNEAHLQSSQFTWQEGLSRLLRGFAFGDQESIYKEQVVLPYVEGNDAVLLGKLMLVLEQLAQYSQVLRTARTAEQWQTLLQQFLESLFDTTQNRAFETIYAAIAELTLYCEQAGFEGNIELLIVQDFLNNHFSQPDPGRHFLVGQVTFCSMLPMRSIPFKVIAILGLNDGEFPRQRQPLGFDLMANSPAKLGDRSRRGDDRYMFLEAIISARKALYLSYQGRSIRNDNEKQPSLVLKELLDYLSVAYGWQCEINKEKSNIRQLPMQPFSLKNYLKDANSVENTQFNSFDPKWLSLAMAKNEKLESPQAVLSTSPSATASNLPSNSIQESEAFSLEAHTFEENTLEAGTTLHVEQLIRFFQHPVKAFAHNALNIFFEDNRPQLEDVEPFDFNALDSYLFKESLLSTLLNDEHEHEHEHEDEVNRNNALATVKKTALLSGKFPELPHTEQELDKWQDDSLLFTRYIAQACASKVVSVPAIVTLNTGIQISVKFPLAVSSSQDSMFTYKLAFHRSSTAKPKDFFTLYIHQLLLQLWQAQNVDIDVEDETLQLLHKATATHGFYFDTKSQKVTQYFYEQLTAPEALFSTLISAYEQGQMQPLLVNTELAENALAELNPLKRRSKSATFNQNNFENLWHDPNSFSALGNDPYITYFWPQCPEFETLSPQLRLIYQAYVEQRQQVKAS